MTKSPEVQEILNNSSLDIATNIKENSQEKADPLPIIPNYLKNPVFPYYDVEVKESDTVIPSNTSENKAGSHLLENGISKLAVNDSATQTVTFKVRVKEKGEDFVEVEVPSLSYQSLLTSVCEELELSPSDVAKIRKLPNILVRKDKDVLRLREGQELEVVLNEAD